MSFKGNTRFMIFAKYPRPIIIEPHYFPPRNTKKSPNHNWKINKLEAFFSLKRGMFRWLEIRYVYNFSCFGGKTDFRRDQGGTRSVVLKVTATTAASNTTKGHCVEILTLFGKGGRVVGLLYSPRPGREGGGHYACDFINKQSPLSPA